MKIQDLNIIFASKFGYLFKDEQLLRTAFTTIDLNNTNSFYTKTKLEEVGKLIINDILKYYYINDIIKRKERIEINTLEMQNFIDTVNNDEYLSLRCDFLNLNKYLLIKINDNADLSSVKAGLIYSLFGAIYIDVINEYFCDEHWYIIFPKLVDLIIVILNPKESINYCSQKSISTSYDKLKHYCLKNNIEVPEFATYYNGLEWRCSLLENAWYKIYKNSESEAIEELSFLLHVDLVIEDIIKRKENGFQITLNNALDIYRELYYAGAFTDIMEFKNFNPNGVTEFVFRKTKYSGRFASIGECKRVLSYYILFYTLSAGDYFILDLDSNEDFYDVEIE